MPVRLFRPVALAERAAVTIHFAGRSVRVPASYTVAAAMLSSGECWARLSVRKRERRGPFCMMGACFECLVVIDGVSGRRACQTRVADGMRINRQSTVGEAIDE